MAAGRQGRRPGAAPPPVPAAGAGDRAAGQDAPRAGACRPRRAGGGHARRAGRGLRGRALGRLPHVQDPAPMPSPLARKSGRRAAAHGAAVISPAARTGRSVLYGNMSPSSRRPAGGFSKACRPQKRMAGFPAGRQNKYAIRQHGKGRRTSWMAWGIRARPGGARGSCTRDAGGRAAFRRPGGPPARIATRDADPAARRRVAGHAGAWRAGGAPGAGRTAIRGASCGIAEDAGRQLRLRPGRGAASGSVSRRGAPAPRGAGPRSGGFALRKLRPAISTGENFATNGAVRVAVWPQRAKFLASDRAAACLGH